MAILPNFDKNKRYIHVPTISAELRPELCRYQVPSCGPGLNYLIDALPLKTVLSEVLTGSGECAAIDWTFLGQSLPVWSLVFFSVLLLICLWQLFRTYPVAKKAYKK